ncbi:TIGR03936 family radical SAM-associated protein [Caldicellulosiruptor morganii]|uniref:TIGR03936 family radical SAM-associated protein n=1 Tax=Caldicellulosiruptor morganii TaxID=1387555 RepID=A0ABY7BKQ5_9FIRM|nr:TIGR03936 family radical SAM-associated protein [Caldicellulosiruptor morganii]WAM33413.1 TIGR03936 family radical SAM-associated protein [Caldicellulosiruptor morganii]
MLIKRYRFYFSRDLPSCFISHLDMVRLFERSFRRLNVRLKFTEGFNPHPKITFILPMAVGLCSPEEIFEVDVEENLDQKIVENLNLILPKGLKVLKLEEAIDKIQVSDMHYKCLVETEEDFCKCFEEFIKKNPKIKREKEGKITYRNVLDYLLDCKCRKEEDFTELKFHIKLVNGSYIKPEDILRTFAEEYNIEYEIIKVEREKVNYQRVI